MFSIKDFTTSINTDGVLKNNKYLVEIGIPEYFKNNKFGKPSWPINYNNQTSAKLSLRCDAVSIPGISFASIDGPAKLGYGPIEFTPYNVLYEDINLTFLLEGKSEIHKIFYDWTNMIVNYHSRGQSQMDKARGPVGGMKTYEVGYKKYYSTTMKIKVYKGVDPNAKGSTMDPVMTVTVYNAFPKSMGTIDLNWQEGQPIKLSTQFSYTDYEIEYNFAPSPTMPVESGATKQPSPTPKPAAAPAARPVVRPTTTTPFKPGGGSFGGGGATGSW